jgi:hypothetical protein
VAANGRLLSASFAVDGMGKHDLCMGWGGTPDQVSRAPTWSGSTLSRVRVLLSDSRAASVGITLTIFGAFLPVLIIPYGMTDDYLYLAYAKHLALPSPPYGQSAIDLATAEGRPVRGLLQTAVLSVAGTIGNLRFVRILGVAGIVALALLLRLVLVRARVARLPAALIAVLVCTLPAFQVYGSWTLAFADPWAAFLAGCASLLAVASLDAPRHLKLDKLVAATVLLLIAILIYQPPAMFFWVFFAVALIGSVGDSDRALRLARAHFIVAALALPLAYITVRLGGALVGDRAAGAGRSALTNDVIGKVGWFMKFALYESLNLFDLTPSVWLAAFVAIVAAAGAVLWLLRQAKRPLLYAVLGVILIPLTYLPSLAVKESWRYPIYRSQVSLSALIALYFSLGALAILATLKERLEPRVSGRSLLAGERAALALAVAFVATGVVFAGKNVTTLIAQPQMKELRLLRSQVAAMPDHVQNVAVVLSGPDERHVPPLSDEFGMPSTFVWYPAEPLVLLILREQGRLDPQPPFVDVLPWYASTTPQGASVVNLNGLLRSG